MRVLLNQPSFEDASCRGFASALCADPKGSSAFLGQGSGSATGALVRITFFIQINKAYLTADLIYLAEREGFEPSQGLAPL